MSFSVVRSIASGRNAETIGTGRSIRRLEERKIGKYTQKQIELKVKESVIVLLLFHIQIYIK